MDKVIRIRIGDLAFEARLNDTRIAGIIWEALPLSAAFNFWGEDYKGFKGIKGTERITLGRA